MVQIVQGICKTDYFVKACQLDGIKNYNAWLNAPQILGIYAHILAKFGCIWYKFDKHWIIWTTYVGFSSLFTNLIMAFPAIFIDDYKIIVNTFFETTTENNFILMMIFFTASSISVLNGIFFHVEVENEDIKYFDSEYKTNREAHNVSEIIEVGKPSVSRGWWLFVKSKFEKKTMEAAFS